MTNVIFAEAWTCFNGMCNELALANRVIIVTYAVYKTKAEGRQGAVGWETMIIQGDLAQLPRNSTKYQVIVPSESLDYGLPKYLKSRYVGMSSTASELIHKTHSVKNWEGATRLTLG